MSKIQVILFFLLGILSTKMYSQKGMSTIYFEDGTTKKWFIKVISNYKNNTKFTKPVYRIVLHDKISNDTIVYEYIKLKKKKKPFFMKVIIDGKKAALYSRYHIKHPGSYMSFDVSNPTGPMTFSSGGDGDLYYAKKKDSTYAMEIYQTGTLGFYGSKFKRRAQIFFSDCPDLTKKINNKEFKTQNVLEVFEYYENSCN